MRYRTLRFLGKQRIKRKEAFEEEIKMSYAITKCTTLNSEMPCGISFNSQREGNNF